MLMRSRVLLSCLAVSVFLMMATGPGYADDSTLLPENPLVAARTFESKNCVHCHLVDFQREGFGPDLGRISQSNNMYDIAGRMWNSAPDMISKMELIRTEFPKLSPTELANLLAYLGVYQNYVIHYSRRADLANGEKLFLDKKCNSCHTFDPEANTAGPSLHRFRVSGSPLSVLRAMWLHSYYMRKAGQRMGIEWPRFSEGEINDLLAFIVTGDQSGERQPHYLSPGSPLSGKKLFTDFDCDKCHAIAGNGPKEGPDLSNLLNEKNLDIYIILEELWNHSPTMWETLKKKGKKAPRISTDDLADIIAYLFFINFDRSTGSVQLGEKLFDSKSCSTCHEPTFPSEGKMELLSRFWNHLPEMLIETRQQGIAWPTFSEGEMSCLIEYLMSVKDD